MPSPTEAAFREVEQVLDQLIADAVVQFKEHDVAIIDESARTYHYKNQFLSWSYRFESRRPYRGPEIASVTVNMTWDEPAVVDVPREIRVWSQAAILQIGKAPRWEHTVSRNILLMWLYLVALLLLFWSIFAQGMLLLIVYERWLIPCGTSYF